jgi:hypothetical protein
MTEKGPLLLLKRNKVKNSLELELS